MKQNQLKGKTLLVVHTGPSKKKFTFQIMKRMGLKIICINHEKTSWARPYVDHWIIADTNNQNECLENLKLFCTQHPTIKLDGVITFWEVSTQLVSKISDIYSLVGIPYSIATHVKNKFLFREFCEKNSIKAPKHVIIHSAKEIDKIEKKMHYPLVIKPVFGHSSVMVMRINNKKEFIDGYQFIKEHIHTYHYSSEWDNFDLLVEEYIDGDEVDIDILLQNGKIKFYSISDNYNKNRDRFFTDNGQAVPSSLTEKEQTGLIDLAEETLEKLGIQNGCIHFEGKATKHGPVPIEVNMRLGGDYICSYIEGAWGVNLAEGAIRIALGDYIIPCQPTHPKKYIIGWDLQPPCSGIISELYIDEALKKLPYLEDMYISKEVGDIVLLPPEGYDNLGWITVSGYNLLDAQDNLKEALSYIDFKVAQFDTESTIGKTKRSTHLGSALEKKQKLIRTAKIEKVRHIALTNQRNFHIGIVTNTPKKIADYTPRTAVQTIKDTLQKRGYAVSVLDVTDTQKGIQRLLQSNINLAFNLCDAQYKDAIQKSHTAALLDMLHIPYIGADHVNLDLARDKIRFKKFLEYHTIPTPKWDYAYSESDTIRTDLTYPLIVKPGNTDNSLGITNASVVQNKKELNVQLKHIFALGQAALVEEYIEGDELAITILGNTENDMSILPITKTDFSRLKKGHWHIYTQESKEQQKNGTVILTQKPITKMGDKLKSLLTEISLDTYRIARCKDYGRVEIRVDKDDNPYILEINPNPALHPDSPIIKAAKADGLQFGDVLEKIISIAITRYKK